MMKAYNLMKPYSKGPGISSRKEVALLKAFALDMTATQTANFAKVNRNTANLRFREYRVLIVESLRRAPRFFGEVEIDTAYFGKASRKKLAALKKRGLPAPSRKPVIAFGALQRGGAVFVKVISDSSERTLMPLIRLVIEDESTVYSDEWRAFSKLLADGYKHRKVNHAISFVDRGTGAHTGSIDGFWSFAKRRLAKFNGLPRTTAVLHLKECEWRYNTDDTLKALKKLVRNS